MGLAAVWLGLALLVDPRGDFPLVDDWSYGRTVKVLVEDGKFYYDGWSSPTLFLQILYGALFCLPFGFSFEALRISGIVSGFAGSVGTYLLLREARATRFIATVGSLVVALNPIYFQHSFTFMTDVPFTAVAIFSGIFFLRALRTESTRDLVIGTILASCAILIRQIGAAVPLGYAVARLATTGLSKRVLLRSAWPLGVGVAVLTVHHTVIDYLQLTPALQGAVQEAILARLEARGLLGLAISTLRSALTQCSHVALLILPFLLVLLGGTEHWRSLRPAAKTALALVCTSLLTFPFWAFWPPVQPVYTFAVADLGMQGQEVWGATGQPMLFRNALWLAEFAAIALTAWILGAFALQWLGRRVRDARPKLTAALLGATATLARHRNDIGITHDGQIGCHEVR